MELRQGKQLRPQKILLYGVEGIGKSSFAGQFPNPIFIDTEDRLAHLDVASYLAKTSDDIYSVLQILKNTDHGYKTLVLDTVDWAEKLITKFVISRADGKNSIEDFGYGKGYKLVAEEFQRLLDAIEKTMREQAMHVVLVAHSKIKTFNDPITATSFDRYNVDCMDAISASVRAWVDCVFFANFDTIAEVDPVTKKARGKGGRIRTLYTTHTAAFDAKNSWDGLPDQIDMEYKHIAKYIGAQPTKEKPKPDPKIEMRERAKELAKPLGGNEYLKTLLAGRKFLDLSLADMEIFIQTIQDDLIIMENK
jgi:hypothetical protein